MLARGEIERLSVARKEIENLVWTARRQQVDSEAAAISAESRLVHAYHSILGCAIVALRAKGYRIPNVYNKHLIAIQTMRFTLGLSADIVEYCQNLRKKRNQDTYEGTFRTTETEAGEAVRTAREILGSTVTYLQKDYADLFPQ